MKTSLYIAVENDNLEIVNLLISRSDIDINVRIYRTKYLLLSK